jgi:hypothetical protein
MSAHPFGCGEFDLQFRLPQCMRESQRRATQFRYDPGWFARNSHGCHAQAMKRFSFCIAALAVLLVGSFSAAAQDKGPWRAASSDAKAITGDLYIADARLTINFSNFTIAEIRSLTATEAAAAFSADSSVPGGGHLYRLDIPATKRFQHHNTLCGSDDTQWMATWGSGSEVHIAFFSGLTMPVLTIDALANSTSLCGSFSYVR